MVDYMVVCHTYQDPEVDGYRPSILEIQGEDETLEMSYQQQLVQLETRGKLAEDRRTQNVDKGRATHTLGTSDCIRFAEVDKNLDHDGIDYQTILQVELERENPNRAETNPQL